MKKYNLLFIVSYVLFNCVAFSQDQSEIDTIKIQRANFGYEKYSLLGNASSDDEKAGYMSVALDRFGDFYPKIVVDNNSLRQCGAALRLYYMKNRDFKTQLNLAYNYKDNNFDDLHSLIIKERAEKINEELKRKKCRSVTFIMTGYRNDYVDQQQKLDSLREKINNFLNNDTRTMVVKVYWDATHNYMPLSYGNVCSYYAGLGLRQLISKLDCDEIVMISHSLGANVLCETLFNQTSKVTPRDGVDKELQKCYTDTLNFPTPKQQVFAGIVACAIPGENTFCDYFDRSPSFNKNHDKDNYHFIVGFNKFDFAIKKIVGGIASSHLSSTTLGCMENEYDKVKKQFTDFQVPDHIDRVDFSYLDKAKKIPQRKHDLRIYQKMPEYNVLLEKLYKH